VYGQHEAGWLSFYDYFAQICGLSDQTQKLCGIFQVAKNAGWWLPHKNICWISERHNELHRDDDGRLHCTEGPALSYPDGWSIYAVGGVRVDEQVIMRPETQTLDQIRSESNAEIKRIRIERYGWKKYLEATGAKVLDRRRNDIEATHEALMQGPDGETVLIAACCSTGKIFSLEVPTTVKNCLEAQNWLSAGLSGRIINAS
jgi:hypothetical protein